MNKENIKIVFFGTPDFSKIVLEKLIKSGIKPDLVVTAPDKPIGRKKVITPPPVKILSEKNNLEVFQPEKLNTTAQEKLKKINPDLFLVVAYGKILNKDILEIPKKGSLNLHPSLLPKWRGPSPIQSVLLHGDKKTGSTIMLLDEKMDHGPILTQKELEIKDSDSLKSLTDKLAKHGADLMIETIPRWNSGKVSPIEQNHESATYCSIITRENGHIDWHNPAKQIINKFRAFDPWPGIFSFISLNNSEAKRLKFLDISICKNYTKNTENQDPGTILEYKGGIIVQTTTRPILVNELQLEGEKPWNSSEILKRYPNIAGTILL